MALPYRQLLRNRASERGLGVSCLGAAVPAKVQRMYVVIVALVARYMIVAMLFGLPSVGLTGGIYRHGDRKGRDHLPSAMSGSAGLKTSSVNISSAGSLETGLRGGAGPVVRSERGGRMAPVSLRRMHLSEKPWDGIRSAARRLSGLAFTQGLIMSSY
jgi:hypothetical protein